MIYLVLACDKNYLIGSKNALPWHYKEDLKHFKNLTLNKTVLMGENTFKSILFYNKKPLENRKNVVATFDKNFHYDKVETTFNPLEYVKNIKEDIYVIGGKSMYELFLPLADKIFLTFINQTHEGDVFLNKDFLNGFYLLKKQSFGILDFCEYERIKK